ncbi:MAG TPA: disulfide bond formation protein B [Paraburkholderia sp.]|uniref:disulfide bond formation protein B n=1 Tax=Paraburkholderia sp. TaxID=1926495 RepID=UPI002B6549B4|nr:disulfide bond formation protein B [Paraburkholderia sp.]HTR05311.1 disulfide bond formation protein B [Paraburkholderia sp.]
MADCAARVRRWLCLRGSARSEPHPHSGRVESKCENHCSRHASPRLLLHAIEAAFARVGWATKHSTLSSVDARLSGLRSDLLGLICLAPLGGALYFRYVEGQAPCLRCILQRYAYILIAIVVFFGAQMANRRGVRAQGRAHGLPGRFGGDTNTVAVICCEAISASAQS